MNHIGKIAYLAVAAALLSGVSAEAAQSGSRIAIHYNDLNLTSQTDGHTLLVRLQTAANRVCGGRPQMGNLHAQGIHDACVKDAMDHAVASLHSPVVVALYNDAPQALRMAAR